MAKELSVVGKSIPRVESIAKATGTATFTVDVKLPGMLHAKFLRSPHAHARIKRIDTTKAEAVPGVMGVVTHDALIGTSLHKGDVFDDRVRFVGDAVAGVAAKSEEIALIAAELMEVKYEVLPGVFGLEEALAPDAPKIWPKGNMVKWPLFVRKIQDEWTTSFNKGDIEKGFKEADVIIENTMDTHAQFHCAFEPHACVARWDPGLRELTFWVSTQDIYGERRYLSKLLNLPREKVRIICTYVGGGFGSKVENTLKEYELTALLSVKTGKPVRYEPNRAEESIEAIRHPARFYYKIGCKKDGTLTAIYQEAFRSGGAHTSLQKEYLNGSTDYVTPSYFMCDNVAYKGKSMYTTMPPCAAYRGFGYLEAGAAMDQSADMVAEAIGMDPLEFWTKNVPTPGYRVGACQGPLTTRAIGETIEKCAEAIGWKDKWHKVGEKTLADGRKHGIGLGHAMARATLPWFLVVGSALIKVQMDGKVHLIVGIADMGQGQATGLAQIAAEAMGVPFDHVTITWGDSIARRSNFQAANSTTMMSGNATKLAAEDAKKQLFAAAAPKLGVGPEDLDVKDGKVYVKAAPEKQMPIGKVVSLPGVKTIVGQGRWSIPDEKAFSRAFTASVAEVAVDTDTGLVEVINLVQGNDCGTILSRKRIEGQLQGVLSGGIGFALSEDWIMDQEVGGRILNGNFSDYKIATSLDTMDILQPCVIVEAPDPIGPYGARGMGETVLSPAAPAILNAIYNAIGVRFNSTPITPDKVLRALGKT